MIGAMAIHAATSSNQIHGKRSSRLSIAGHARCGTGAERPQTKSLYFSRCRTGFDSASRRNGSPSSFVTIISITVVLPSACRFTDS